MSQPPAAKSNPIVISVLIANLGVLLVLFFGPNSPHEVTVVAYLGAALAAGAFITIVRQLLFRRRSSSVTDVRR